eukprot:2909921-Prymnesium_polylepis.1
MAAMRRRGRTMRHSTAGDGVDATGDAMAVAAWGRQHGGNAMAAIRWRRPHGGDRCRRWHGGDAMVAMPAMRWPRWDARKVAMAAMGRR